MSQVELRKHLDNFESYMAVKYKQFGPGILNDVMMAERSRQIHKLVAIQIKEFNHD